MSCTFISFACMTINKTFLKKLSASGRERGWHDK